MTEHEHEPYSHHPATGFRCSCGATAPTGAGPWTDNGTVGCVVCAAPAEPTTDGSEALCEWHRTISQPIGG